MENKKELVQAIDKKEFKFGWIILIGCMLIQAIPFTIATNIHPQFVGYIVEGEGFTLGAFSLTFTIGTFVSAIASPMVGKSFNNISAKLIFTVGSILCGGGVVLLGLASSLPVFYLGYSVAQVGTVAISSIGVPLMITAWFDETSKGKALGLAFAGASVGNIFLQQILAKLLISVGYSQAYLSYGIAAIIVGVVVSIIAIRMPKDSSEMIKGKVEDSNKAKVDSNWGYTFSEVKSLKAYWIFAVSFIFMGIYVSSLAVQYAAYLKSLSFDPAALGVIASMFAAASLLGNLRGGALYDKVGPKKAIITGFFLSSTACISLILAPKISALAYLFPICKGLSVFTYIIGPSFLTGSLFGKKDFGAILAITNIFFAVGFALGSSMFGFIADGLGYSVAWYIMLAFIMVGYAILLTAINNITKLNEEKFGNRASA